MKKRFENQFFLPKILKYGHLEGKAYDESKKKLEIQKKSQDRALKNIVTDFS